MFGIIRPPSKHWTLNLDFHYKDAVTTFNGNEKSMLRKYLSLALLYHARGMIRNVVIELIFDQLM